MNTLWSKNIEPHTEIVELRKKMKFDYGKFDYVIHDGKVVLLDINKTIGIPKQITSEILKNWQYRAEGIYSYF